MTSSASEALNRLIRLDTDGHRVLSLYLNFDPARFPSLGERRTEADALLASIERDHPPQSESSHRDRIALRQDLDQVRAFLTDAELTPQSARGLAVFCSAPAQVFEVVMLPRPVEAMVAVQTAPFVEPLLELVAPERWCVLLISRRATRILRGTRERLSEVADVLDDVHRHHAEGGWSQARYQRGVEHEVDEHIRSSLAILYERFRRRAFDRLLIGSPSELRHRVEAELHPDLRQRLAGHFELDVERIGPDQVRQLALPLIEADESRRERAALKRLDEGLAPDGHGAVGLDEVLSLLDDRRVQTLLLAPNTIAPGFACPRCGRLSAVRGLCPAEHASLQPRANVIEDAIQLALDQSADVMIVRHTPEGLGEHRPIAALLRY